MSDDVTVIIVTSEGTVEQTFAIGQPAPADTSAALLQTLSDGGFIPDPNSDAPVTLPSDGIPTDAPADPAPVEVAPVADVPVDVTPTEAPPEVVAAPVTADAPTA